MDAKEKPIKADPRMPLYQGVFHLAGSDSPEYRQCRAGNDSTAIATLMQKAPEGTVKLLVYLLNPVMDADFPSRREIPKTIHHS